MKKITYFRLILSILMLFLLIPLNYAEDISEKDLSIEILIPEQIVLNQTYNNLFKIINNNHTSGITDNILVTVNYYIINTTINKTFQTSLNSHKSSGTGNFLLEKTGSFILCGIIINSSHPDYNLQNNFVCKNFEIKDPSIFNCNISIGISTEKEIYENEEKIIFYNTLNNNSLQFIIEYWIEDIFGNIIKQKTNTTNLNSKSYTPKIDESDKSLLIKNKLYISSCTNSGTEYSQKIINIKNNITKNPNSSIILEKYPSNAEFGETILIDVSLYKGDTSKRVVYFWLEKEKIISEKSKITVWEKYTSYSFSIPLQIYPNCNNKFEDDFYNLIIEGLDQKIVREIKIKKGSNDLCKIEYIEKTLDINHNTETNNLNELKTQKPQFTYILQNIPEVFYTNQPFNITINFTNTELQTHNISVHAYIYKSSKCFSLSREYNNHSFQINPGESKLVKLEITNINTIEDSYNLKVRIKKNELKTYKEITETLPAFLKLPEYSNQEYNNTKSENYLQEPFLSSKQENKTMNLLPTGLAVLNNPNITVFESKKEETKGYLIPILFIILILGIIIFLGIKKPLFSRQ